MCRIITLHLTLQLITTSVISLALQKNCDFPPRTSDNTTTCPDGYEEVYRDKSRWATYTLLCCLPESEEGKNAVLEASNCRSTRCYSSTETQLCGTLNKRYINGRELEYEEVLREPCTKTKVEGGGSGVVALCCQRNSHEGVLVSTLGAEPNEFPHHAKVEPVGCGGTVYNKRFVITASHCIVDHKGALKNVKDWQVILGSNIRNMESDVRGQDSIYKVKRMIPHEKYSKYAENKDNVLNTTQLIYYDVALLELEQDIQFSDNIKSLEIAPANFNPFAYGDNALIVGWGQTDTLAQAIHLQKSNIILRHDKYCFEGQGPYNREGLRDKGEQLLCLGGTVDGVFGGNTGSGDSGGPSICRNADGNPVLCGITSFGGNKTECVKSGLSKCKPSVHVEVAFFRHWIQEHAGSQDSSTFYRPYLYGKEVPPSKYPHQVHITSAEGKSCGGTLVQPDIVVTAAQCVMKGDGTNLRYSDLKVTTGVNDLKKAGKGMSFGIADVRVLEGYKMKGEPVNLDKETFNVWYADNYHKNDLAVLKLDKKTPLKQVKLPRLPRHRDVFNSGVELAFPRNTTGSGQMRSRDYKLLDMFDCRKRIQRISGYEKTDIKLDDNLLCGVEKYSGGSTCDRELGGGLICKDSEGKEVLCGIQVYRICKNTVPNMFIDMMQFAEWLDKMISEMIRK